VVRSSGDDPERSGGVSTKRPDRTTSSKCETRGLPLAPGPFQAVISLSAFSRSAARFAIAWRSSVALNFWYCFESRNL
jgi:hypothetical protein